MVVCKQAHDCSHLPDVPRHNTLTLLARMGGAFLLLILSVVFYIHICMTSLLCFNIYHHWFQYGTLKLFNTLRPKQVGRLFADNILKRIFLNENVWILIKISLKFVCRGPVNNIPALVQIMAWRHPGKKPLSEPMMVSLPTHICVTRPQWVKKSSYIM